MPPSGVINGMAQYARNSSVDSALPNENFGRARNQFVRECSNTPQIPTGPSQVRQTIAEAAKLPAPKSVAPANIQAQRPHQPIQSELSQPQPQRLFGEASRTVLQDRQHRRANSLETIQSAFWPESQIDSHQASPTTEPSERYDEAIHGRLDTPPTPPDHLKQTSLLIDHRKPFTIRRNDDLPESNSLGFPLTGTGLGVSRVEITAQRERYPQQPEFSSPRRAVKLSLNSVSGRRTLAPSAHVNDQETFSGSAASQMHNNKARRLMGQDLSSHQPQLSADDDEAEGSLDSDYTTGHNGGATPRVNTKKPSRKCSRTESSFQAAGLEHKDKPFKRHRDSCDYLDDELAGMTYAMLRQQSFDDDPLKKVLQPATPLTGDTLQAKLEHFKGQREADQQKFFTQMNVSDWERSGDWLLDRFGQVAQKLKEARKSKRELVDQFESEISSREETVRQRTESIIKKMGKIKHKGEDMLADKEI